MSALQCISGRGHGDALAARRELVSYFLDAIRALDAGWHPGVKDTRRKDSAEMSAELVLMNLCLFAKYAARDAAEGEIDEAAFEDAFKALIIEATLPNKRRMDRRHLAHVRKEAADAARHYANFAREIHAAPDFAFLADPWAVANSTAISRTGRA